MNTDEYMPMFLAESAEHLQELNLAVVRLEEDPSDSSTLDEIFRSAHTLKGMSATMGFTAVAELTHHMEEVFERLRKRDDSLTQEAVDAVLACLDALSGAFESIEAGAGEQLDPAPLISRLRALVRAGDMIEGPDPGASVWEPSELPAPTSVPDLPAAPAAAELALPGTLHVRVRLDEEVLLAGARAFIILGTLTDHGQLVASRPDASETDGFTGHEVEAWLRSDHEPETVIAAVSAVSDVTGVTIDEADGLEQAVAPAPVATPAAVAPLAPVSAPAADRSAPERPAPDAARARTVRVDAERLDGLMHAMGELVVHRTAVQALTEQVQLPGLDQAIAELTRSSQALQAMVMQVRMIPVDIVFLRFPRLVRDLSAKLGKDVRLSLVGSETELDRTVVDALGDPLVHLVRNALDHGLETPEQRAAAGKPAQAVLEISARHAGGSVVIGVRDDGCGVDVAQVARKAVARGLIDEAAAAELDMRGAIELLFAAGFSTAETTSDISGRGVGLDAVRAKIRELGGEVVVDSAPGEGTSAQIRLPLTLAIVPALQVEIGAAPYAIPLDRIERTLRLSQQTVRSVAGRRMLMLDDGILPLVEGAEVFGRGGGSDHEFVVIVRARDERVALSVDALVGQREVVARPLPSTLSSTEAVSGGAALADGRIALIVDCDAIGVAESLSIAA